MAKITLDILKKPEERQPGDMFRDLNLSYQFGKDVYGELEKDYQLIDIFTDTNLNAIANSFVTILTTTPGSKILNPRFGVNLGNLLFLPVTSGRGQSIGEGVVEALQKYEPRILVQGLEVLADPENNQYTLNLRFKVPTFNNEVFTIKGRFKDSGFYIEK